MFTMLLLVLIVGGVLYYFLKPKPQPPQPYYGQPPYPPQPGQPPYPPQPYGQQGSGMGAGMGMLGGLAGGAMLGYLLSRSMISPNQYDQWRNMDRDQLQNTLASNGIMNSDQFSGLEQQAGSGALNQYLPPDQQQYLQRNAANWDQPEPAQDAGDWSGDSDGGSGGDWGGGSDE
jgi:hypothetical protein